MDVERFFDVEASVRSEEVDFGDEDSSSSSDESPEEETCEVEGRLGAHDEGADLVRSSLLMHRVQYQSISKVI